MPAATGPAYVPARPDSAANDSGGAFSFLDRFFGADARETVVEKAQDARANLSSAGNTLVATARAHPLLAVLTVVGGIAAVGLLANPAARRAAIAGGTALWGKYGDRLPGLLPKP